MKPSLELQNVQIMNTRVKYLDDHFNENLIFNNSERQGTSKNIQNSERQKNFALKNTFYMNMNFLFAIVSSIWNFEISSLCLHSKTP